LYVNLGFQFMWENSCVIAEQCGKTMFIFVWVFKTVFQSGYFPLTLTMKVLCSTFRCHTRRLPHYK
jgi:hypothetical protein